MMARRKFSKEFKEAAIRRLQGGQTVAELERKIGQQALEIDFLKRALQHVEEQRLLRALSTGAASTSTSKKKSKQGRL